MRGSVASCSCRGIERNIGRHHVLLINFPAACAEVRSFDDIAALKRQYGGLVVAPHPFYPIPSALGSCARPPRRRSSMRSKSTRCTRASSTSTAAPCTWARAHGKPLVGNTDLHLLDQMGTTYSLVDAEPHPDAICDAIRAGRVEVRTAPLSSVDAATLFTRMCWGGLVGRFGRGRTSRS